MLSAQETHCQRHIKADIQIKNEPTLHPICSGKTDQREVGKVVKRERGMEKNIFIFSNNTFQPHIFKVVYCNLLATWVSVPFADAHHGMMKQNAKERLSDSCNGTNLLSYIFTE